MLACIAKRLQVNSTVSYYPQFIRHEPRACTLNTGFHSFNFSDGVEGFEKVSGQLPRVYVSVGPMYPETTQDRGGFNTRNLGSCTRHVQHRNGSVTDYKTPFAPVGRVHLKTFPLTRYLYFCLAC